MRAGLACAALIIAGGLVTPSAGAAATHALHPADVLAFSVSTPAAPPTTCRVDRSDEASFALGGKYGAEFPPLVMLGLFSTNVWQLPVAAVCDSTLAARGAPVGGIGGTLADARPMWDALGAGYRAREAFMWNDDRFDGRAHGLVTGDRLTLPITTPDRTAALWIHSGAGTTRVLAPADIDQVRVDGESASGVRLVMTRGTQESTMLVPHLPAPTFSARATRHGKRVRVVIDGAPAGAAVFAGLFGGDTAPSRGTRTILGARFSDAAARSGIPVGWGDLATRRVAVGVCKLDPRSHSRMRCRQTHLDGAQSASASRAAGRMAAAPFSPRPAASHHPQEGTAQAARSAPDFVMREVPLDVAPGGLPAGDLDGDGYAELIDLEHEGKLFGSFRPSTSDGDVGPLVEVDAGSVRPAGDVDGDGHVDTLLQGGRIAFGTGRWEGLTVASAVERPEGDPRLLEFITPPSDDLAQGPDALAPLPDSTGDGHPELGVIDGDAGLVLDSSQLVRGALIELPRVVDDIVDNTSDGPYNPPRPLVDADGLHFARVLRRPTRRQPIAAVTLETRDARGAVQMRSPTLGIRGEPSLFVHDPACGDLLIGAEDEFGHGGFSVVRLGATGQVLAATSTRGEGPAVFGPDGPDADAVPEIYIQTYDGVRVLESGVHNRVPARTLPLVTDARGRVLHADVPDPTDRNGATPRSLTVQGLQGRYGDRWSRLVVP